MSEWTDSFWRPNGPELEDNVPVWDDEEYEEDFDKVLEVVLETIHVEHVVPVVMMARLSFETNVGFRLVYSVGVELRYSSKLIVARLLPFVVWIIHSFVIVVERAMLNPTIIV